MPGSGGFAEELKLCVGLCSPPCTDLGCDGSTAPGKGLTWRGEEEPVLLQTCSCAGSPQQGGHLEQVGMGAAMSWSQGFSHRLCSVTLSLGSLMSRSSAGHIPCLSLLSLEQAGLCQPLAGSSHTFGFSSSLALWDCRCVSGNGECAENCRELPKCSLILKMSDV